MPRSGLREPRPRPRPPDLTDPTPELTGPEPALAPTTARGGRVDAAASIMGTLLSQGGAFAAGLLVVRWLGAEARGVVALVTLTYRQAAVMGSLGLEFALLHFGARSTGRLKVEGRRALLVGLGQGAIAALVGWVVLQTLLAGSVAGVGAAVTVAALAAPAFVVLSYGNAILRATGRLVEASAIEVVAATTTLGVVVAGVFTERLWLAVVASAAGTVLAAASTAAVVLRLPGSADGPGLPGWTTLLRYGLAGHVGTVFQNLNYRVDFYLVALLLSTTDVGIYALAVSLTEALLLLPDALGLLVMQRAAARPESTRATEVALRLGLAAAAIGGGLLAVGSHWVVPKVFGPELAEAPDAVLALLPGMLALAIWRTLTNDLAGRGFPAVRSTSAAAALVTTLAGNLLLIPHFGIVGAAAASSTAYVAAAAVSARRYRCVMDRSLTAIALGR